LLVTFNYPKFFFFLFEVAYNEIYKFGVSRSLLQLGGNFNAMLCSVYYQIIPFIRNYDLLKKLRIINI
jgi:hypothetical protein